MTTGGALSSRRRARNRQGIGPQFETESLPLDPYSRLGVKQQHGVVLYAQRDPVTALDDHRWGDAYNDLRIDSIDSPT